MWTRNSLKYAYKNILQKRTFLNFYRLKANRIAMYMHICAIHMHIYTHEHMCVSSPIPCLLSYDWIHIMIIANTKQNKNR